jgi:hypothetical protein
MEQPKAMEYGSQKASPDFLKPRNIYVTKLLRFLVRAESIWSWNWPVIQWVHDESKSGQELLPVHEQLLLTSGSQTSKAFRRPSSWFHSYGEENFVFFYLPSCRLDGVTAANSVYVMQMTHRSTALLPVSTPCSHVRTLPRLCFALSLFASKYISTR